METVTDKAVLKDQKYLQFSKVFAMLKSICNTPKYLQYSKVFALSNQIAKAIFSMRMRSGVKLNERIMQKFSNELYFLVF